MKETKSLLFIDWRLAGRMTALQSLGRFALLFIIAMVFLSLLQSAGGARFIASKYNITALLKESVSEEEAAGLARQIAELAPVSHAEYRDSDASWKEFIRAYPGVEPVLDSGNNPLPGYVEVRISRDRFNPEDVDMVISALKPLAQVDKVLAGEEFLPKVFKVMRVSKMLFIGGFALLAALFFVICRLQERILSGALAGDFEFLAGRGVARKKIMGFRAMGAAFSGALLATAAFAAAVAVLNVIIGKYPSLAYIIGPGEELFSQPLAVALGVFVLLAAFFFAGASLSGWTPLKAVQE